MATNALNGLRAVDEALKRGWQLRFRGGDNLVIVEVFKPKQAWPWTTVYVAGGVLDALTQTGETIREVLS